MRHIKLRAGGAVDEEALSALIGAAYLDVKKRLGAERASNDQPDIVRPSAGMSG
jgi:hypothetical protein